MLSARSIAAGAFLAVVAGPGLVARVTVARPTHSGFLPPVEGALLQEAIDVGVIVKALRALRG